MNLLESPQCPLHLGQGRLPVALLSRKVEAGGQRCVPDLGHPGLPLEGLTGHEEMSVELEDEGVWLKVLEDAHHEVVADADQAGEVDSLDGEGNGAGSSLGPYPNHDCL